MRLNIKGTDSQTFSVSKNQWIHLVIRKNTNNKILFYFNGSLKKKFIVNYWYMSRIRVGINRGSDANWVGNIDDVKFYNYVLTSDSINSLYQSY